MNNKQRRAAKAKQRKQNRARHAAGETFDWADPRLRVGAAVLALRAAVRRRILDEDDRPLAATAFAEFGPLEQQAAFDEQLAELARVTVRSGWTPADLAELGSRRLDRHTTAYLLDLVAAETTTYPADRVDPSWQEQLSGATPANSAREWARRRYGAWDAGREPLMALLTLLCSLPVVPAVMSPPGAYRSAARASGGVDERVLRRVRALLAKAESSEFADEADALTAKAQELMTRHAIEHSLATADAGEASSEPAVRRLWLDAPYVTAKALLVDAVAQPNHCRNVISERWGFVTLIGEPRDLDTVELLTASLLVQATRAMTASGSHVTRSGRSRTRSFRQSFLVAYASRIGERLRETNEQAEAEADAGHSGTLLPVLARRDDAVSAAFAAMFPELVHRGISATNAAGYGAGRAAADLALFDVFGQVADGERAS